jgi:hypothetical protein
LKKGESSGCENICFDIRNQYDSREDFLKEHGVDMQALVASQLEFSGTSLESFSECEKDELTEESSDAAEASEAEEESDSEWIQVQGTSPPPVVTNIGLISIMDGYLLGGLFGKKTSTESTSPVQDSDEKREKRTPSNNA